MTSRLKKIIETEENLGIVHTGVDITCNTTKKSLDLVKVGFNKHATLMGEYEDYTGGYGQNPLDYLVS